MSISELSSPENQQTTPSTPHLQDRDHSIAAIAPVGIFRTTQEGEYIYVNQCWCELTGISAEAAMGRGWETGLHPDDRDRIAAAWYEVTTNQSDFRLEYRFQHPDGSVRWVLGRAVVERSPTGEVVGYIGTITDITEQKSLELALQQSENRLRLVLENMPVMLDAFDEADNIIVWNQECERVTGYLASEVIYNPQAIELLYPDLTYRQQMFKAWGERGHRYRNWEWSLVAKNGETRTIAWSNLSEQFPVSGWATWGIGVDVTERREAEAKLFHLNSELEQRVVERTQELVQVNQELQRELLEREQIEQALQASEERYRQIVEVANEGIWEIDADARTTFVNPKMAAMLGCTPEEMIGTPLYEFVDDEGKPFITQKCRAGRQGIRQQYDFKFQRRDGSSFWAIVSTTPRTDANGQPVGTTAMLTDISERKQAEALVLEQNRRWRSLLDNVQLIVVQFNQQGIVDYINPYFLKLTGYREKEVLGQSWFNRFFQGLQQPGDSFQQTLQHSFQIHSKSPIVTKSGTERMISWTNTVLNDLQDNPIGVISIGEDVTQRHQLERMKSEFIAVASHELRTPITSISGALQLLSSGLLPPDSEQAHQVISIANTEADRLSRLVDDILDLERLESGKVQLVMQPVNLADLMHRSIALMQPVANSAGITLTTTPLALHLKLDGDRILQVLTNLLSNAIKFSASGSQIQLTAIQLPEVTQTVQITLCDQGRGIPADKLESIFERFHQVDASDSRKQGGTGLGLAICRSIVEQHGGKIWVDSSLGEGSCFHFTLPLIAPS